VVASNEEIGIKPVALS